MPRRHGNKFRVVTIPLFSKGLPKEVDVIQSKSVSHEPAGLERLEVV